MGSQLLNQVMHVISQSLMIPCYAFLLFFVAVSVIETGTLFGEMIGERKYRKFDIGNLLNEFHKTINIEEYVKSDEIPARLKNVISEFMELVSEKGAGHEIIAQNLLSHQESILAKKTGKTELISKMGPLLGLMGTLIPLGPGLVGLGKGDFGLLAQYLTVSFDATIIGIFAGSLTFAISKIRRRFYDRFINDLDSVLETLVEVKKNAAKI